MSAIEQIGIVVGVVSGISGLFLGILNYRHQRSTARALLEVRPRVMHLVGRKSPFTDKATTERNVAVMEVLNVGRIPVVGSMIGFVSSKRRDDNGIVIASPQSLEGAQWPGELAPGHKVTLRMETTSLIDLAREGKLKHAFVNTMVGDAFFAEQSYMQKFRSALLEIGDELDKSEE